MAGYIDRRHMLPLIALSMPSIGVGCTCMFQLSKALAVRRSAFWLPPVTASLAVILLAVATLPRCLRPLNQQHLHALEAADWIGRQASQGDSLLSNSPYLATRATLDQPSLYTRALPIEYPVSAEIFAAYCFVAVEGDKAQRHARWTSLLDESFQRVATIKGDRASRQQDIVIYQRRDAKSYRR